MPDRSLSSTEISLLEAQGCSCSDWSQVDVAMCFNSDSLHNVSLSGKISLGEFNDEIELFPGLKVPSGIRNSRLHNCSIDNNVYINSAGLIANYCIGEGVIIDNVRNLITEGITSFGNGSRLDIVNEAGGRTLPLFERLTANLAYLMVFYRHNKVFTDNLDDILASYVSETSSAEGIVQARAVIKNSGTIKNTFIGFCTVIDGAMSLKEGTIASTGKDPVFIGQGVCAGNFIIQSGAHIDEGALLNKCFIGQSVKLGKQFSAENSAFFANSELFHGEACSVFCGPFSVTHHKSTLLIAGLYSFYNAGSGTNQSNHMYKLGPVHQGILERGSKTGSFSYLLWPSRIGAFTTVLGKHYTNFDTSLLPFSYINEEEGKSYITPAMNMFTAGTRRDSIKWPLRDRRKTDDKLDLISYEVFSPYTVYKMAAAADILKKLYESTPKETENINYQGILIKRLLLKTSVKFYEMGIKTFIGSCVAERIKYLDDNVKWGEVLTRLSADTSRGIERWVDLAGLFAPESAVQEIVDKVEDFTYLNLDKITNKLNRIYKAYDENKWAWCAALVEKRLNIEIERITASQLIDILSDWKASLTRINNMIIQDAEKEYDAVSKTGYGIDGNSSIQDCDFQNVRGSAENDSFIAGLKKENLYTAGLYDRLEKMLKNYLTAT